MDVEAYLRRIRYRGPREPSAAALHGLHRRHLFNVPFENLDIPLGTPIKLDTHLFFKKVVTRGRGGYCYELNSLFHALLEDLGFDVCMLSAQVRRDDGSFGPDFDHMLLKVALDDPWLADVGFGDSFVDPLPLLAGTSHREHGRVFGVVEEDGVWELFRNDDDGMIPLYRFSEVPRQLSDFENMNQYQQSSPDSGFTSRRVCSIATPDGRITLSGMRLIVRNESARTERVLSSEVELRRCLREYFGVEFDEEVDWTKLTG
jgi:N-hydroxyarylamine O-acetyltransferase